MPCVEGSIESWLLGVLVLLFLQSLYLFHCYTAVWWLPVVVMAVTELTEVGCRPPNMMSRRMIGQPVDTYPRGTPAIGVSIFYSYNC